MKEFIVFASFAMGILCASPSSASDQLKVFARDGNIFFQLSQGKTEQITKIKKDKDPKLSPDGARVIFLRKSDKKAMTAIETENIMKNSEYLKTAYEIWGYNLKKRREYKICEGRMADNNDPFPVYIDGSSVQFSLNSQKIYFITPGWVTSNAVWEANADGSGSRFVCDGNELYVITNGDEKGNLIVLKHKYFAVGGVGSYDWYWIVSPEGKEVDPLGPPTDVDKEAISYHYGVNLLSDNSGIF